MKRISIILTAIFFWACFQFSYLDLFSQTTGYSGTGANIDVTYQRCEWRINPDSASKGIKGNVTVYFVTKAASVSSFTLDLRRSAFNNANLTAKYHGASTPVAFLTTANVITITLPSPLAINTLDSVTISYNGAPPAVAGQAEGYQLKTVNTKKMIYTLSESYEDRDWWPCKADMQDKIDSLDIIINVPSAHTAAANGVLISTTTAGSNRIFYYKHRYPIASYLVAVAVSEYTINNRGTVNINGTNMPVDYYYLSNRSPSAAQLQTMDRCKDELIAFSSNSIFGDYPFKNEKYGMYEFGWGGGMEHQTFSAMSWGSMTSWSVIAHELGHQWFGDKVTFGTWNHLWLAEGFARYMEALAAELVPALGQNASTVRFNFKDAANNTYPTYSCYIPNSTITTSDVLWSSAYGSTVYERGAMVVSMLRTLLGDAKFFQACRNYLNDPALAYRSATTDDLRNHMQTVAGGYDLTPFFNSYVYGNGYPSYNTAIRWGNPGNNRISFKVTTQTKSTGSTVSYYHTPIAIRVRGSLASQDTVLVIYDQNGQLSKGGNGISTPTAGNYIYFMLGFNPVTVTFDPLNQTLVTGAAPVFDNADPLLTFTTLDVKVVDFTLKQQSFKNELDLALSNTKGEIQNVVLQKGVTAGNFEDAGVMNLVSETNGVSHYHLADNQPFLNETFYRARITEKNGVVTFSKILNARMNNVQSNAVYPNPASKSVTIKWSNSSTDNSEISLYNVSGKMVMQKNATGNSGNLSVSHLPAGTYLVIVKQGEKVLLNSHLIISK